MLKCAVSVPKLAIAVQVSVKNTTTITVSAVLHPAVVALIPVVKWLRQWRKFTCLLFADYKNNPVVSEYAFL
jgi:hypothetical protein